MKHLKLIKKFIYIINMGNILIALALGLFGVYVPKIVIFFIVSSSFLYMIVDLCFNFLNWKKKINERIP